ncbi:MAG: hypothetical protein P1U39_04740 [Legionellaceae bacterium]|nr:hypothetical protein [Legionellaceae bacterium]
MLFFDDKLLLKYSGVTGSRLVSDRTGTAFNDARVAYTAACDARDARDTGDTGDTGYVDVVAAAYHARACAAYNAARADYSAHKHTKPFKPFNSSSDAALSVLSVISAPILLTLLALDEMLSFIVSSLKSIYNFVTSKPDIAKESGAEAVGHLFNAFKALFAVTVSPVVNTVDFVGSCVTTLTTEADENPLGYNA